MTITRVDMPNYAFESVKWRCTCCLGTVRFDSGELPKITINRNILRNEVGAIVSAEIDNIEGYCPNCKQDRTFLRA